MKKYGPKAIRLVMSDIDDTLLHGSKKLSEDLKKEIHDLQKRGVVFALATGRLPYEMEDILADLPEDTPYVAGNGSVIRYKGRSIFEKSYRPRPLKKLAEKYAGLGVTIIFSLEQEERPLYVTPWSLANATLFHGLDHAIEPGIWDRNIKRMYFYEETGAFLNECIKELQPFTEEFGICFQNKRSIQIAPKGCTKATGIERILTECGLGWEDTLCIGDSWNDCSMVTLAGIGACVGNACDDLKRQADIVAKAFCGAGVLEILRTVFD